MKTISLLLLITVGFLGFSQTTAKGALIELESNFSEKKFDKKWNKKRAEWEAICDDATTMEELNKSFNEYSDLMAQTIGFSMGNSDFTVEEDFVLYLLKVESTIPADYLSNWAAEDRNNWRAHLNDYVQKEVEKRRKEDQMVRFQKMSSIVKDFDKKFPQLWEDSKKNAFANSGEVKIKGSAETSIDKDNYGVASYHVFFDTDGDLEMAKKLVDELVVMILENAGEGYKRGNEMDPSYEDNILQVYQFEGAKFAETAKRPTVSIGVTREKVGVQITITEPVFGH